MSFNIEIRSGSTIRLLTKGKYCDRDIVITAIDADTPAEDIQGVIKAGTYVPGDTFTTSRGEWYYIPMRFMHNGNEYSELSTEGLLGGIVTYVSADGERHEAGTGGTFTDKGEITILEDCDTRELSNYPAEYDWFTKHYTLQSGS